MDTRGQHENVVVKKLGRHGNSSGDGGVVLGSTMRALAGPPGSPSWKWGVNRRREHYCPGELTTTIGGNG